MRHLNLIVLSFVLTGCTSLGNVDSSGQVEPNPQNIVEDQRPQSDSVFAQYLYDYVNSNIVHRARTSRSFIDRSDIESNGRLPSKSLYQSLGYRVRNAFVAAPPELSTRNLNDHENLLLTKLIQDTETTWALLDTTKARLKSKGGLEHGRQDWEIAITRRNLLLEAIGYWYQLREQNLYDQGLTRLDNRINELYEEITKASQDYDVEDLRDNELALLGLRTDVSLIFQYYTSEQARLYNRTDSRTLPNNGNKTPNFSTPIVCSIDRKVNNKGLSFLNLKYRSRFKNAQNSNNKSAVYELNQLARDLSSDALALHAKKLNSIEKKFITEKEHAEKQREAAVLKLIEDQKLKVGLGETVDPNEIELLKSSPLNVYRKPLVSTVETENYYNAIVVLSSLVAEKLAQLNKERLTSVLTNIRGIYTVNQESKWQAATNEVKLIRDLLYGVYDSTLVDYLVGYERIAFANKALLHGCRLDAQLNSNRVDIDLQHIEQLASFIENNVQNGWPKTEFKSKLKRESNLKSALLSKTLGKGFQNSVENKKVKTTVKKELLKNGFNLANTNQAQSFVKGQGYTIEVGAFEDAQSIVKMIKRFKKTVPKLIYLSKKLSVNGKNIYKILIGQEQENAPIVAMKGRIGFGEIKTFNDVRNDLIIATTVAKKSYPTVAKDIEGTESVKRELSKNGFRLATKQEVHSYTNGLGYSVEVGAFEDAQSILKMIKRFKAAVPKLIYVSKNLSSTGQKVYKILIGQERESDSIEAMKGRIGFGEIKTSTDILNDI